MPSTSRRCAFLTLADPGDFVIDDECAREPLAELGWSVTVVPWTREDIDWGSFDAVIVRSTWDHHHAPERFLAVLEGIASTGVPLFNSLSLIRWNISKRYLLDLSERGVPIVPTTVHPRLRPGSLPGILERVGAPEVVLKPVVGANADGAFRVHGDRWRERLEELEARYVEEPFLAQPFVTAVVEEGEYSLFYFDGSCSHAILKTPAPADFRTQEEHGATIRPVAAEGHAREAADAAVAALPETPLYARVDLARSPDPDVFWVMELEVIDPSLYLRTDLGAPRRFARAFRDALRRARA